MAKYYTEQQNKEWIAKLPKKTLSAKVIITSTNGNVLLVKPTYKKAWQLPGGGPEIFEDPESAAVREVLEETGLRINKQDLRIIDTIFRPEHDVLVLIYEYTKQIDESTPITLPAEEHEGYRFENPSTASAYLGEYYQDFWLRFIISRS
jgi:8-oxo-dGTP pyrophosphatase MutT (NUDIX family)